MISFENLSTGHRGPRGQDVRVSRGLTNRLQRGELVCLLGPNGAGKSTLLNTLSGELPPIGGQVRLEDEDLHALAPIERARRIAVVLTEKIDAALLSGYAYVCLGRHPYTDWIGRLTARDHQTVEWALEVTGAASFRDRFLAELSDGERQRLLVARALAQEPQVLLLDEITAFLDLPHRVHMMRVLRTLVRETGQSVLLSSHDLDLALRAADRIWLLTAEGLTSGAPEDLVLSGAFERAFADDEVVFDRASGAFRLNVAGGLPVSIAGRGEAVHWARRAIERAGFVAIGIEEDGDVDDRPTVAQVAIEPGSHPVRWTLQLERDRLQGTSIEDLVAAARTHIEGRQ